MVHPLMNDIVQKLEYILNVLESLKKASQEYMPLEEAAKYLCISKSTLYKHTSEGEISFYKPNGKLIVFKKKDLDDWIGQNRILSNKQLLNH